MLHTLENYPKSVKVNSPSEPPQTPKEPSLVSRNASNRSETPKLAQSPKPSKADPLPTPSAPPLDPPKPSHHNLYSVAKIPSMERLPMSPQGSEENLYNMLMIDTDRGKSSARLGDPRGETKRTVRVVDPNLQVIWENSKDGNYTDLMEGHMHMDLCNP